MSVDPASHGELSRWGDSEHGVDDGPQARLEQNRSCKAERSAPGEETSNLGAERIGIESGKDWAKKPAAGEGSSSLGRGLICNRSLRKATP